MIATKIFVAGGPLAFNLQLRGGKGVSNSAHNNTERPQNFLFAAERQHMIIQQIFSDFSWLRAENAWNNNSR